VPSCRPLPVACRRSSFFRLLHPLVLDVWLTQTEVGQARAPRRRGILYRFITQRRRPKTTESAWGGFAGYRPVLRTPRNPILGGGFTDEPGTAGRIVLVWAGRHFPLVFIAVLVALIYLLMKDRPLKTWYPHSDEYLGENLRREGRGLPHTYARCAGVRCRDPDRQCPNQRCEGAAEWRCAEQACMGEIMQCGECIVAAHARLPTHFVEVRIHLPEVFSD
jgi:hypothetical protein